MIVRFFSTLIFCFTSLILAIPIRAVDTGKFKTYLIAESYFLIFPPASGFIAIIPIPLSLAVVKIFLAGSSIQFTGIIITSNFLLCDFEGNIISEKIFPGRAPKICCLSSKQYIILYDRTNEFITENLSLKSLGENLTELWEKHLLTRDSFAISFMIQPLNNNHFIAAGYTKIDSIVFYEFDERGNQQGYLEIVEKKLLPNKLIFRYYNNKIFVCFQLIGEKGNKNIKILGIEAIR